MIHLRDVWKRAPDPMEGDRMVLRNVTVTMPAQMRIAVLGKDPQALTALLRLVSGSEQPDSGRVIGNTALRCSPIINMGGRGGGTLTPQLTPLENIFFFAQASGLDPGHLLGIVESACRLGRHLRVPLVECTPRQRRALEIALIATLPYDCYLIDRLDFIEMPLVWQIVAVARERNAGMICTMNDSRKATFFSDVGAVVREGEVRLFPQLKTAIAEHELA